jgi:glycosyltransferase involved in cell wall biosynthesis
MSTTADICLVLESTYPYIRGGVSSWVHQLISGLPQFSFALYFIGSRRQEYGEQAYSLPDNVLDLKELYLFDFPSGIRPKTRRGNKADFVEIEKLHQLFRSGRGPGNDELSLLHDMITTQGLSPLKDFLFSMQAWEKIRQDFFNHSGHPSFNEYFWLVRNLHLPIFALGKSVPTVPDAQLYHSISTGYAGFMGALLKKRDNKPYIISEHGIYTKERKIDLAQAAWIAEKENLFKTGMDAQVGYLRNLSIHFFEALGKVAYQAADSIIALSNANRDKQVEYGASPEKTHIISNGINRERFLYMRKDRPDTPPPILGFIGRVVPIKDVKTFIRSIRILCNYLPEAEGWIIGPEDEDQEYAAECKTLVDNLELKNNVTFFGFQRIDEFLPKLGLMVMTSISEGQPLVILEAFASGLPVVASDVGFCKGMILGDAEEDRLIGAGGRITPIADPSATANACLELLSDPEKWQEAKRVAELRVDRFYDESLLYQQYQNLYTQALDQQ